MDVLDESVKPILMSLCGIKNADEFVFVNPKTKKPHTDIKKAFATARGQNGPYVVPIEIAHSRFLALSVTHDRLDCKGIVTS